MYSCLNQTPQQNYNSMIGNGAVSAQSSTPNAAGIPETQFIVQKSNQDHYISPSQQHQQYAYSSTKDKVSSKVPPYPVLHRSRPLHSDHVALNRYNRGSETTMMPGEIKILQTGGADRSSNLRSSFTVGSGSSGQPPVSVSPMKTKNGANKKLA